MMSDIDWRAKEDARTLAMSVEIKSDRNRYEKAKNAAKRMVSENQTFLNSLKKVADNKTFDKNGRLDSVFHSSVNLSRRG